MAGAEQQAGGDDAVAGGELGKEGRVHGRHAGRGGRRLLGTLDHRHAPLEHAHGGIADPGVHVAGLAAGEARFRVLRLAINEARGQKKGLAGLAEGRAQTAGVDELGCEAPGGLRLRHRGLSETRTPRPEGSGRSCYPTF